MPRQIVHIEKKSADAKAEARLRDALLRAKRPHVTPAEAAALSGLPIADCTTLLFRLSARYPARVRLGDAGTLSFSFENLHQPLGRSAVGAAWARFKQAYAAHGEALLGVLTLFVLPHVLLAVAGNAVGLDAVANHWSPGAMATLTHWLANAVIVPVVVIGMVLMLIQALILAMVATIGAGLGMLVGLVPVGWEGLAGLVFRVLFGVFFVGLGVAGIGAWRKELLSLVYGERAWAKRLRRAFGGFLFGPMPAREDTLADERRLMAMIVAKGGIVTTADLCVLFGWTPQQSDAELSRILSDYGGDVELTPEGALLYRFDHLAQVTGARPAEDLRPAWLREPAEPAPFWGCPPEFAVWLLLVMAVATLGLWLHPELSLLAGPSRWLAVGEGHGTVIKPFQGLGVVPYLLLLLPIALRLPLWARARTLRARRSRYMALLRAAIESPQGAIATGAAARDVVALDGEYVPELGEPVVRFPRFALEAEAARRARKQPMSVRREDPFAEAPAMLRPEERERER
jgi:hypothetical protein